MTNQYGLDPFKLKPVFAERVWGRQSLMPWFADPGTTAPVGEAWLTGPACVIESGENAGRTLADLSTQCVGTLGDGEFPLLVKILFVEQKLSVQVHPDDEAAAKLGLKRGKTECWYVLEAEPGASVMCGLKHGVSVDDLKAAAADGSMEELLQELPVAAGDMIYVDAGTVHAIGPGLVLLEVQQMSDVTYRLWDYGRDRELHLADGLAVVKTSTDAGKREARQGRGDFSRLIDEKYFTVDRFEVPPGMTFEMPMDGVGCVVGVQGNAAANALRFSMGEAVVLPVGSVTMSSAQGGTFLRILAPGTE